MLGFTPGPRCLRRAIQLGPREPASTALATLQTAGSWTSSVVCASEHQRFPLGVEIFRSVSCRASFGRGTRPRSAGRDFRDVNAIRHRRPASSRLGHRHNNPGVVRHRGTLPPDIFPAPWCIRNVTLNFARRAGLCLTRRELSTTADQPR